MLSRYRQLMQQDGSGYVPRVRGALTPQSPPQIPQLTNTSTNPYSVSMGNNQLEDRVWAGGSPNWDPYRNGGLSGLPLEERVWEGGSPNWDPYKGKELPDLSLASVSNVPVSIDPSSAFEPSSSQVTARPVSTTTVATENPFPNATIGAGGIPWTNWRLPMEGTQGGFNLPYFRAEDLFLDQSAVEAEKWRSGFEAGEQYVTPEKIKELSYLNIRPEARSLYGDFGQKGLRNTSYDIMHDLDADPNTFNLMIKSADKEGTVVPYKLQDGYWVPQTEGIYRQHWDTNSGLRDWLGPIAVLAAPFILPNLFSGLSSLFGGAAGAAEAAGALGAEAAIGAGLPAELGGVSGIIGGSTAAPALSAGLGTGFAGTAPITGTLPSIVPGAAMGAGAAGIGSVLAGSALGSAAGNAIGSAIPGIAGDGAGMIPPVWEGGASTAGAAGSVLDTILKGGSTVGKVLDVLTGGGGGGTGIPNVGRNATGLAGLISSLYGQQAAHQRAKALEGIANRMQEMASPYLSRLRESYENPQAYLESPEMQAILSLEANRLAGIDASRGRLSNDINRTAALQQLAQSRLGDYRRGLQSSIASVYQPQAVANLFRESAIEDANRWRELSTWIGGGGSPSEVWSDIKDVIDVGKDLWDIFSSWWD